VMVSLADGADARSVAARLAAVGLGVEQVAADLGFVTGTCEAESLDQLRRVAGVAHVERTTEFELPKPDSPVQ
jgi:hypothetical protein